MKCKEPSYCRKCGKSLLEERRIYEHDVCTGDKKFIYYRKCPDRDDFSVSLDDHSLFYKYDDSNLFQKDKWRDMDRVW